MWFGGVLETQVPKFARGLGNYFLSPTTSWARETQRGGDIQASDEMRLRDRNRNIMQTETQNEQGDTGDDT